jgi:chromosome segregation ATPase
LLSFFLIIAATISSQFYAELEGERNKLKERSEKLNEVIDGALKNLDSLGNLNAQLDEIRRLVADTGTAIIKIENHINNLEQNSTDSTAAAEHIAQRISELNQSIENESAAQIESSASINEMVASIRNVAESAARRRTQLPSARQPALRHWTISGQLPATRALAARQARSVTAAARRRSNPPERLPTRWPRRGRWWKPISSIRFIHFR